MGGWSYGGGMAMTYSIKHPEIKNVISIAGVDWGEYYEKYLRDPEFKKTTFAPSHKCQDQNLGYNDPQEHGQRIDSGIGDCRLVIAGYGRGIG